MADAIATWLERRPRPEFHADMFGGTSAAEVRAAITAFATEHVGEVDDINFYVVSRGAVAGVQLADGTQVACKFLPLAHDRLEVLHESRLVQQVAFDKGLPVPTPRLGPVVWRTNACFVDEWLPSDPPLDGARVEVRNAMAEGLFATVDCLRGLDEPVLRETRYKLPVDAPRCADAAVDEALAASHAVLARNQHRPMTVGHFDWRTPNAVVDERGTMQAIYDWDSVVVDLEERIVGAAAAFFSMGYTTEYSSVPTPDETRAFVETYESARGERFYNAAREVIAAAVVYKIAWQTREERLLDPSGVKEHERSVRRAFRRHSPAEYAEAIRS